MAKVLRWAFANPRNTPGNQETSSELLGSNAETVQQQEQVTPSEERGAWTGKLDFMMSLIAYAVGLGNVWRFPYLCFKNGGGAFLIPYAICWSLAAMPIFYLEVSMGQFLQQGGIGIWKVCPIFKGVGISNMIMASMCNVYYCVIVSWSLFYLFSSFAKTFPWENCDHSWNNNDTCVELRINASSNFSSHLDPFSNKSTLSQTPVEQFWERRVLQTSDGIENTGGIQWELALLLLFAWCIVYFALWRGITKARKFVYFCALSPYFLLGILLVRGLTLPGAAEGLKFYIKPDLSKMLEPTVWKDAGTQVFYSYGIGFGTLMALGSYNDYHHNVLRDAGMLCVINVMTSLVSGVVVFSVLGYMAVIAQKTVEEVVKSGVGLAFLVYPEVVVNLPVKQLWSALFFLMICILGMDSQVCTVEGVVTALSDQYPNLLQLKRHEIFVGILCAVNFLLGLPMVSQGGQYWLTLLDQYGASGIAMLWVVFFEIVGLSWGFGAGRIYKALEDMMGRRPGLFWRVCWQGTAPVICFVLFLFVTVKYVPLKYADGSSYPSWAEALGLMMSATSMIAIPAYALYYIITCKAKTFHGKIRMGLNPLIDIPFNDRFFNRARNTHPTETELQAVQN